MLHLLLFSCSFGFVLGLVVGLVLDLSLVEVLAAPESAKIVEFERKTPSENDTDAFWIASIGCRSRRTPNASQHALTSTFAENSQWIFGGNNRTPRLFVPHQAFSVKVSSVYQTMDFVMFELIVGTPIRTSLK